MKIEIEDGEQMLSLERKIKMHEAREGIIERLAQDLPDALDIDRFLRVIVSEIGRMIAADRCDVLQLTPDKELRISQEWRADESLPSSIGTTIPLEPEKIAEHFDLTQPIRVFDTEIAANPLFRLYAASLQTRSLLVVPIISSGKVLGLLGLHDTKKPRVWTTEEVHFLQSIAAQIAAGYRYMQTLIEKNREAERTNALLEIANTLNSHSDFGEVSSMVLTKAIELVGAVYSALGVVNQAEKKISLAAFKSAPKTSAGSVQDLIQAHGQALDYTNFPAIIELLKEGKTLKLLDTELPAPIRLLFNARLGGRAALVAPVKVGGQTFGLLGFVWGETREEGFDQHEIALVEGIADQIGTALERDQLSAEVMRLKSELSQRTRGSGLIGQTKEIRRTVELALSVADTPTTVLIEGESGTGKELVANLIRFQSGREGKPYVKLNCGAIPESLLESELFGHEKGAFTDARSRRRGRFEEADGGTLFLDEIGEMSLSAQVSLLRVLQDGEFTRIGGSETVKTDVRVIAATNVVLEKAVEEGKFRRDLFYRLSVFPIKMPSLRERREDIQLLVIHFLEMYKQKTGRFVSGISKQAMQALINYDFPGNVRELENAIERALIIASGRQIELDDLPPTILGKTLELNAETRRASFRAALEDRSVGLEIELPTTLAEIEKQAIEITLDYTKNDKTRASKLLGIGRKTLYRKLEEFKENGTE